jgi:hypothetical protein
MIFASLVLAAATATFTPRPLSPAEKASIMRQADELMFDGPATRWQWPERRNAKFYCGKLNGKNQLGAYTGWRLFYVNEGAFNIIDKEGSVYEGLCGAYGYYPKPQWLLDAGKK